MLQDEHKEAIRALYQRVTEALPSFRKRAGQREMIGHIARVFSRANGADGANIAVVEGRTGVGKTIGYLVPGVVMAAALGKRLVVSTGTVALQEQLYQRDIPAVLSCMDEKPDVALLKGRGRFVCPERLSAMGGAAGQESLFGDATWERRPEDKEIRLLRKLSQDFADGKWNGEIDTLDEPPPSDLWARVVNDQHACVGRRCPSFASCSYFKHIDTARKAAIVVANHDLVLACIASESKLLPAPEETLYAFDEAHHLPDAALSRFAAEASTSARRWIERIPQAFSRIVAVLPQDPKHELIGTLSKSLGQALSELEIGLRHSPSFKDKPVLRFANGNLDASFGPSAKQISKLADDLYDVLENVAVQVDVAMKNDSTLGVSLQRPLFDASHSFKRLGNFKRAWGLMTEESLPDAPLAKWIVRDEVKGSASFRIHASPILAGPILREMVWSQAGAAILTSATLTTLGKFDYFLKKSGLYALPEVTAAGVASPFNYEEQAELLVPAMTSDPSNAEQHTQEVIELLPRLLDEVTGGGLVLFASRRQMEAVRAALLSFKDRILMQGEMPRTKLLDTHRERVGAGQPSIIFGLAGFGEGLDLPGVLCELVCIAKIPFPQPDSPIEEALAEWVERRGGNPFYEITLPKAGLILIQWSGRLIRTESDTGRIVLLDRRLRTKARAYGDQLLDGLPPFRRLNPSAVSLAAPRREAA